MEFGEHGVYMLGCTGMIISNYKDIDNQANIVIVLCNIGLQVWN